MKNEHSFPTDRLIGFVCSASLPMLAVVMGILFLFENAFVNPGFAILCFLIPLITIGLLAWCIFSGCETWKKVVLSVVILVLYAVSSLFASLFAGFTKVKRYEGVEAERQYTSAMSEHTLMPELSDIGQPTEVEYYHVDSSFAIFCSETNLLIGRYAPGEYEIQKARLDEEYTFQTETITHYDSSCEPKVEIDGYQFRMLSIEEYEQTLYYPKDVILIGYSDEAREIVYIAFHDFDLDYIPSLKNFIMEDCGWKYVR